MLCNQFQNILLIAWFDIKNTIEFIFISSDIFLSLINIRIRQKIWDISVWIRSFEGSGRCFSSDASFLYHSQFQPSSIYVGILEQKMKLRIVDRLRCTFYFINIKELQNGIWWNLYDWKIINCALSSNYKRTWSFHFVFRNAITHLWYDD